MFTLLYPSPPVGESRVGVGKMTIILVTILGVISVLFLLGVLFVCYFKITRKTTWRDAVAQAVSDILM